jgi:hypothetical protein
MNLILLVLLVFFGGHTYPVTQQYGNGPLWVSSLPDTLTQFNRGDGIGLLAHNTGAGAAILMLTTGDVIIIYDENDNSSVYIVDTIYRYRVFDLHYFRDLATGAWLDGWGLLAAMYADGLTLQTCISNGDNLTWGRLFVHAAPGVMEMENEN